MGSPDSRFAACRIAGGLIPGLRVAAVDRVFKLFGLGQPTMKTELRHVTPKDADGWHTYHELRRSVLWEGGKRFSYRSDHPDETAPGNYSMLFLVSGTPVGVVRIDLKKQKKQVIFRRMAISIPERRKGYGTLLIRVAEDFARKHGCDFFIVDVTPDELPFYRQVGYSVDSGSAEYDPFNPRMTRNVNDLPKPAASVQRSGRILPRLSLRLPSQFMTSSSPAA